MSYFEYIYHHVLYENLIAVNLDRLFFYYNNMLLPWSIDFVTCYAKENKTLF